MTAQQLNQIRETLLSCKREFEELENQYEWFTTPCIDRIEKTLKLLSQNANPSAPTNLINEGNIPRPVSNSMSDKDFTRIFGMTKQQWADSFKETK